MNRLSAQFQRPHRGARAELSAKVIGCHQTNNSNFDAFPKN
jgi:hypothetical protein